MFSCDDSQGVARTMIRYGRQRVTRIAMYLIRMRRDALQGIWDTPRCYGRHLSEQRAFSIPMTTFDDLRDFIYTWLVLVLSVDHLGIDWNCSLSTDQQLLAKRILELSMSCGPLT